MSLSNMEEFNFLFGYALTNQTNYFFFLFIPGLPELKIVQNFLQPITSWLEYNIIDHCLVTWNISENIWPIQQDMLTSWKCLQTFIINFASIFLPIERVKWPCIIHFSFFCMLIFTINIFDQSCSLIIHYFI